MKKIFFMAFAVAGFSQVTFAQSDAARMTPAPTQAQIDKDTKGKVKAAEANSASIRETPKADPNVANYKKAGLAGSQISNVSQAMNEYDKRKTEINRDAQLTAEEKKNALAAIETERNAVLRKSMGEQSYKKYTELTMPKQKPAKSPSVN